MERIARNCRNGERICIVIEIDGTFSGINLDIVKSIAADGYLLIAVISNFSIGIFPIAAIEYNRVASFHKLDCISKASLIIYKIYLICNSRIRNIGIALYSLYRERNFTFFSLPVVSDICRKLYRKIHRSRNGLFYGFTFFPCGDIIAVICIALVILAHANDELVHELGVQCA